MISTNDIYPFINLRLMLQGFFKVNLEEKKKLMDTELKNYIISKLNELESTPIFSGN